MANIKQIAEKANVSIATVSRVLNYDETLSVTDSTRKRIFQVAEELNYSKYKHKHLNKGNIAIVQWYTERQELQDLYYLSIRMGAEAQIKKARLSISHFFKDDDISKISASLGVIAIGRFSRDEIQFMQRLNSNIVIIGQDTLEYNINCVVTDMVKPVEHVLQYFLDNNLNNIGIVIGNGRTNDNHEKIYDPRLLAFREFLRTKRIYNPEWVLTGPVTPDSGYLITHAAIDNLGDNFPNALFIASDTMAIGALKALKEANIAVPNRVNIVSFNDSTTAEFSNPTLSSIKVYTEELGSSGFHLLQQKIDSEENAISRKLVIGTKLNLRESSFSLAVKTDS